MNNDDINIIIESLRKVYGPKLFGKCAKVFDPTQTNEAYLIPSSLNIRNSASPTDVLFSAAQIGSNLPFKTAMKFWFSWDKLTSADILKSENMACPIPCTTEKAINAIKALNEKLDMSMDPKMQLSEIFGTIMQSATDYKGLEYEARVYSYITENIIMKNISPTFIPLLSSGSCRIGEIETAIMKTPDFSRKNTIIEKLRFLSKISDDNPNLKFNFIITGSGASIMSLHEFLSRNINIMPETEIGSIVFQLLYSLYVMTEYKISHSDLHFGNVLIQTLEKPEILQFNIDTFSVMFQTSYIIKFFDWDLGSVEPLGLNPKVQDFRTYFKGFGISEDYTQALCSLGEMAKHFPKLRAVLENIGIFDDTQFINNSIDKRKREVSVAPESAFLDYIKSSTPAYENVDDYTRETYYYYLIDKSIILKYKNLTDNLRILFGNEFDSITKFLVMRRKRIYPLVFFYKSPECNLIQNAHKFDVTTLFTRKSEFDKIKNTLDLKNSMTSTPKMVYQFFKINPETLFVPAFDFSKIFSRIQKIKIHDKRPIEDEAEIPDTKPLARSPVIMKQRDNRRRRGFRDVDDFYF